MINGLTLCSFINFICVCLQFKQVRQRIQSSSNAYCGDVLKQAEVRLWVLWFYPFLFGFFLPYNIASWIVWFRHIVLNV